jgi:hypothetical protein
MVYTTLGWLLSLYYIIVQLFNQTYMKNSQFWDMIFWTSNYHNFKNSIKLGMQPYFLIALVKSFSIFQFNYDWAFQITLWMCLQTLRTLLSWFFKTFYNSKIDFILGMWGHFIVALFNNLQITQRKSLNLIINEVSSFKSLYFGHLRSRLKILIPKLGFDDRSRGSESLGCSHTFPFIWMEV